jgi:hypothetical protein
MADAVADIADDGFPIARCGPCGRDVLTHVDYDAGGEEQRRCVHCDAELDPAEVRWVDMAELERAGYALAALQGEGCGRPGCGQGRCGRPGGD